MPVKIDGICDCTDEAAKDEKCCFCLESYKWFKILAWINLVFISLGVVASIALISGVAAMAG